MGYFKNMFYSFANRGVDPNEWRKHFLQYDSEAWAKEGDGILRYHSDDETVYSMGITHWNPEGFVINYVVKSSESTIDILNLYAVNNASELRRFVTQDELHFPAGCVLPPDYAWLAVEDFLSHPESESVRVNWVEGSSIAWPEL